MADQAPVEVTADADLVAFVEAVTPVVEKRLAPPPQSLFTVGTPISTGSKVGDAGLLVVSAPLQILKNAVVAPARWFKPKSKFENPDYMCACFSLELFGLGVLSCCSSHPTTALTFLLVARMLHHAYYRETAGEVKEEDDDVTVLLNKHFQKNIQLHDFFAMVPLAYRTQLLPLSQVLHPAYEQLFHQILPPTKRSALMTNGSLHLRYAHICLLLEVLMEYFFDQHFLQLLWERESSELPPQDTEQVRLTT
jgi:hypothetical protein